MDSINTPPIEPITPSDPPSGTTTLEFPAFPIELLSDNMQNDISTEESLNPSPQLSTKKSTYMTISPEKPFLLDIPDDLQVTITLDRN